MHRYSKPTLRRAISRAGYVGIVVVVVALVAVGGYIAIMPGVIPGANTSSSANKQLTVALIFEGPKLDYSYNMAFYLGLSALVNASHGTITASYVDNVATADIQRVASTYAQQGYNLVIGDGQDLSAGIANVAAQYPNTYFAMYGGTNLKPNLASFQIWDNEGGFLAGYLAASMTKSGKVGDIDAFKYPGDLVWTNGYMLGAKRAATELRRNITVTNIWTATWTDATVGAQAGNSLLSSGVDVIGIDASGPGSGAQTAVKQAFTSASVGPFSIGHFLNQNYLGPFMLGSVLFNMTVPMAKLVSAVKSGNFGAKVYQFYLHDGAMSMALTPTVPTAIAQKVMWLQGNITSGQVVVPLEFSTDLMPTGVITVP